MPLKLKQTPYLFAYAAFLVAVTALLVWQKVFTTREAGIFVTAALAFPGLIGAGGKPSDPPPPASPTNESFILNLGSPPVDSPKGTSFWPVAPGENTRTTTIPVPRKDDPK